MGSGRRRDRRELELVHPHAPPTALGRERGREARLERERTDHQWRARRPPSGARFSREAVAQQLQARLVPHPRPKERGPPLLHRSEEHTSELQSPYVISYAVFCLKKKSH